MKNTTISLLALSLAATFAGCGEDVTTSDEYQALEEDVAALEQQLADATSDDAASLEVPAEVVALLDEWEAANERNDGSVTDLYRADGYHLYGDDRIVRDEIAAHLGGGTGMTHEWITDPLLIAAEPDGRYVVTRGLRIDSGAYSNASALTFEIMTSPDGELEIVQSDWTYAHR